MFSSKQSISALCLAIFTSLAASQAPFDNAETTIITSTSTCYSLPIQTDTATKAPYNETLNSDFISGLYFYLDSSESLTSVFGIRDVQSEADLLFDITDPLQLGIVYPDQSAVIFNGSGITVISSDCSSVVSLVLPGFHDYLLEQGGTGGGTKKLKRALHNVNLHQIPKRQQFPAVPFFPKEYYVDAVIYDQCGHIPDDPFAVVLAVGGGYECRDRADVINGVWQQGVNGLYKWTCVWPSPFSREQNCEIDLLRRLGYLREPIGTLVDIPSLVRIFSQGLSNAAPFPPGSAAYDILHSPYFSPEWSSTMTGLNVLMQLFEEIQTQQLDPNVVAAQVCLPYTNLKEYVSLKLRDDPSYTYILTSVGANDNVPFATSMQFNQEIIASVTSSCIFSGPSTLPLTTPINTNIIIGCGEGTNTATGASPTETGGIPARFRKRSVSVCTATRTSTSTSTSTSSPTRTTSSTTFSTSGILSLTTFTNPPEPSLTCSFESRCDPAPSSACEAGNSALPPGTPFCQCGNNVQGQKRCFEEYDPTKDLPVYCHVREDCPGGMECRHVNPCWFVEGGFPGMCYFTCGPF